VYCSAPGDTFSESLDGQMQGALVREWQPLSSKRNAAEGCPAARPEGAPRKRHDYVAALDKGWTIACALRLVLTLSGGSECTSGGGAVHQ
jgi:hypothetical protein